jgi:hypothetical protein
MFGIDLDVLAGSVRRFDPASLGGEEAARLLVDLGTVHRLISAVIAKTALRVHETKSFGESRDAAHFYAGALGTTSRDGHCAIRTARKLRSFPRTDAVVRDGGLSPRQTSMIVDTLQHNPGAEERLLRTATQGTVKLRDACIAARAEVEDPAARAKRQRAARSLRTYTDTDGMVRGSFALPPEIGGKLLAALDERARCIFRAHSKPGEREAMDAYSADALCDLVLNGGTKVDVTLHVVVDHDALVRGEVLPGERCEIPGVGPVSVEWARSLLGDAFVTAIVKKGKDITTVAHLGRHIPAEVQTALIVGGRECEIEGCDHRGYLERDHVEDLAKGGPTALWNLIWLCYTHHRRKTAGWLLGEPDPITGKRRLGAPAYDTS